MAMFKFNVMIMASCSMYGGCNTDSLKGNPFEDALKG